MGSLSHRELERTPKWIETPSSSAQAKSESPFESTGGLADFIPQEMPMNSRLAFPEKVKVKTRGPSRPCPSPHVETEIRIEEPVPASTISVKPRVFEVFSALFHGSASREPPPGEIPWTRFVKAFKSIGFTVENHYGSARLFKPPDHRRPIIFHEPHPHPKIPIEVARHLGRRLTHTYGWTIDTFVCQ